MHRYVIDDFDKLHKSLSYVVTDMQRSNEFPLNLVMRERNLQPRDLYLQLDEKGLLLITLLI